jgi:hypothetical protein
MHIKSPYIYIPPLSLFVHLWNYLVFTLEKGILHNPLAVFVCKTWRSFTVASKYIRKSKRKLFSTEELLNKDKESYTKKAREKWLLIYAWKI